MKRLLFVVNPISGKRSKDKIVSTIISSIDMKKYDVTMRFSSYPGHSNEIAKEAVRSGMDVVVAVGGDGTVNEVASALLWTSTVLGIIPCGSGNGLARHLGIPINVRKAVEILNKGDVETIDSLSVNEKPCFCTAGIGYDAYVSYEYAKESSRGLSTYVRKALQGWLEYTPQEYIIKTKSQIFKRKAVLITCANANQWGNGFHIAPKASLRDGLMDVTIIHPLRWRYAFAMPFQILGYTFDKNPDVETYQVNDLLIKRNDNSPVHIDGEPLFCENDIRVVVHKNSVKVFKNNICRVC